MLLLTAKILSFLLLTLSSITACVAQSNRSEAFVKTDSILVGFVPYSLSADTKGYLYTCDSSGIITQWNDKGETLRYSPSKESEVKFFSGLNTLNTFVFYEEYQELVLLDRFLVEKSRIKLDDLSSGFVAMAALSSDQKIWVIDQGDMQLKKIDHHLNTSLISNNLLTIPNSDSLNYIGMIEYQSQLYVFTQSNGVYVFDNFCNYLHRLPVAGQFCGMQGEWLYYHKGTGLQRINLYTFELEDMNIALDTKSTAFFYGDKLSVFRKGYRVNFTQ